MEFRNGTSVYNANGDQVGSVDRVVIDPRTKEISHIVVRKGFLFTEDKVIPMSWIGSAEEDRVTLRADAGDFASLPPFEEAQYFPLQQGDSPDLQVDGALPLYWYPTYGGWYPGADVPAYPVNTHPAHMEQNIPDGTVGLKEGAAVISMDGDHVGNIERIIVQDDHATHMIVSQGVIFRDKKLIPIGWVTEIDSEEIHIGVHTPVLKRLPSYEEPETE